MSDEEWVGAVTTIAVTAEVVEVVVEPRQGQLVIVLDSWEELGIQCRWTGLKAAWLRTPESSRGDPDYCSLEAKGRRALEAMTPTKEELADRPTAAEWRRTIDLPPGLLRDRVVARLESSSAQCPVRGQRLEPGDSTSLSGRAK